MRQFQVFDVGHGQCIWLVAENGNTMVWDCGHKTDPDWRPSRFLRDLGCTGIERLFITNYDEDHISDLPGLRDAIPIDILHRNKSVTPEQLRAIKLEGGPITQAMKSMIDMISNYSGDVLDAPDFPGVAFEVFYNSYPADFTDTNNLSLVTFLRYDGLSVVIPGDLERPGWLRLLEDPRFREGLGATDFFVASHHGRESGYCAEVFEYCRPELVIFSDSSVKHASQEMAQTYASHASGASFGGKTRYVVSTRTDGDLLWQW